MEWECAFCGLALDSDAPGSLWVAIGSDRVEGTQGLYVHATCIGERLRPEVMFSASTFEPDDPSEDIPEIWHGPGRPE